MIGCNGCKGSYYYNYGKSWDFLDTIFMSRNRGISFIPGSIDIVRTNRNSYSDSGKPKNFNPIKGFGVSDHLPMVAKFKVINWLAYYRDNCIVIAYRLYNFCSVHMQQK